MSGYNIGLSGLSAAQAAFEVIGNNIANSSTEGYHRQDLVLTEAHVTQSQDFSTGSGVSIEGISRAIDVLLEQEIVQKKSTLASIQQQTSVLTTIETAFGEFSSDGSGLNISLDKFFTALQELSTYPNDSIYQNQLISNAETLASQFRTLGEFLNTMDKQVALEVENAVDNVNILVRDIAELNEEIQKIEIAGGTANNLRDQRDQSVTKLAGLIDIQVVERDFGVVDIRSGSMWLVTAKHFNQVEMGYDSNNHMGICIAGETNYTTSMGGGSIGGFLSLNNEIIADIQNQINALANAIITQINELHVIGVGSAGSFTELTSTSLTSTNLADLDNITDGEFYIRVTNTATGQQDRYAITIDATSGTIGDVIASISAIPGLNASVNAAGQLIISSTSEYEFDFLPCALPEPNVIDFDDATPPTITVSGVYDGDENDTLTFTVIGDGAVGNGVLELEVTNSSGQIVDTVNIGAGYAAGDAIDIGNGIEITVGIGNLAQSNADSFTVNVYTDTDTSGFLSAAGINTFFSGNSAGNMMVCETIANDPRRVATSLSGEMSDNFNVARMANIKDLGIESLNGLTIGEFYRVLSVDIGQQLSTKELYQENIAALVQNLQNEQSQISGVDINEEAAKLLIFEQMYQAMAQYMSALNDSIDSLMAVL